MQLFLRNLKLLQLLLCLRVVLVLVQSLLLEERLFGKLDLFDDEPGGQ